MGEPKRTNQSIADLQVPGWLAVMILSPLVAMAVGLWLDDSGSRAMLIGLCVSVAGTATGAILAKGNARVRLVRGIAGALIGVAGFALAFAGVIVMTILAK